MPEPPRPEPEIKLTRDRGLDGMWRVEVLDADGGCGVSITLFGGRDAEGRARAYVEQLGAERTPTQTEATRLLHTLLRDCQAVPNRYLPPDGCDAEHGLDALLELLEEPRWREAAAAARR